MKEMIDRMTEALDNPLFNGDDGVDITLFIKAQIKYVRELELQTTKTEVPMETVEAV